MNRDKSHEDRSVQRRLLALDWDIEPKNDLWNGINKRLDEFPKPAQTNYVKRHWKSYAVAASFLLAAVSLLFSYMSLEQTHKMNAQQVAFVMHQQSQVDLIEQQHQMVRAQFTRLIQHRRDQLDADFIKELEATLQTVDFAATELKAAMIARPMNPGYSIMLVKTYQQEIKLLNKIRFSEALSI